MYPLVHVALMWRLPECVAPLHEQLAMSYQKVSSYLNHFKQLNPGSVTVFDRDREGRFMRAMVSGKTILESISVNQPVLGCDCAHSKCPWYDGVQMTLVGQDGNRETSIIAFALVPAEDIQNYEWFFRQLMNAGLKFTFHVIFCDRDKALISVADALNLNIRYCTLHIIRNVTDKFKIFTTDHYNMDWHLQAVPTKEAYLSQLGCIELALGQDVQEYLEAIPPVKWCVYANIGVQPMYGWRTSNFVESQFGSQLAKGLQTLPPLQFIQAVCERMLDRTYRRHQNSVKWQQKSMIVTPKSMTLYEA
ncbi:unnamed protein product [Phytophthora fragariaefolia]|uniref:Unnamed protein product n=1 Tax=Phytophthora fragariaefolia TaxID=1490495 RepID=A0A9W7D6H5_9STRA|nr:unnamed protein product [Phytophthora fragariaefolia]